MRIPWSRRRFQCEVCHYPLLRAGELKLQTWWFMWRGYAIFRSGNMRTFECHDVFACARRQRASA